MITISQLAAFAGVTVRAVRHYHARGLLPEPERDASGYRRYDARAAVDLIRIRTLAEAGVPLARVKELLAAGPDEFAAALEEIDRNLRESIRLAQEHRRRVAQLPDGDALALPASVLGHLAYLRELGVSERTVQLERSGWIIVAASTPDVVDEWIAVKQEGLRDDRFRRLYLAFDHAFDASPDDPRLVGVVDDMVAFVRDLPDGGDGGEEVDQMMVMLLDEHILESSPAWRRIAELVQERGLTGWTDIHDTR